MNLGLPDVKGMTDREFILWVCGAILVYLLLLNPLAINQRLETVAELQAQVDEVAVLLFREVAHYVGVPVAADQQ